jgi:hypothetical protein
MNQEKFRCPRDAPDCWVVELVDVALSSWSRAGNVGIESLLSDDKNWFNHIEETKENEGRRS